MFLDPSFWRQQAYLLLRMTLGFALAVAELSLIAAAVGWISMPIWYRWTDENYGSWHVDTLGRALLLVPAGIVALVAAAWFARVLGALSAWQVRSLLSARPAPTSPEAVSQYRRQALWIDGCTAAGLVVLTTIVWAATGAGYYWPQWVLLPLALLFAIHALVELVVSKVRPRDRAVAIHGGVVAAIFVFLVAVWALTSRGYFWPAWTLLGLASALVVHYLITRSQRRDRLARRVETLETTRLGAVEEQDAELRRIERDLHDGAQARLVALGMSLGMAEQKFDVRPGGRAAAGRRGPRRRRRGAARAARPGPRHLPAGARRPRDRGGSRDAGRPQPADDDRRGRPGRTAAGPRSRPPRTSSPPRRWPTRSSTPAPAASTSRSDAATGCSRSRSATTAPAAPTRHGSGLAGLRRRVEALDGTLTVTEPRRRADDDPGGAAVRVVIAEDLALLRDGLARLLRDNDLEVVAEVADADALVHAVLRERPDLAIVDIRLPPTFRDEGLRAALELRGTAPETAILVALPVRRAHLRRGAARRGGRPGGVGYLLKDRVLDVARLRRRRPARRRRRHRARPRGRRPAPRAPRARSRSTR